MFLKLVIKIFFTSVKTPVKISKLNIKIFKLDIKFMI